MDNFIKFKIKIYRETKKMRQSQKTSRFQPEHLTDESWAVRRRFLLNQTTFRFRDCRLSSATNDGLIEWTLKCVSPSTR
jgi:hypothetical protein